MTIPRKKSRRIEVDGKQYRFLIKEVKAMADSNNSKELSVTIQEEADQPGNVVQFRVDSGEEVRPKDIVHNIKRALGFGWNPSTKGPAVMSAWQWCVV